MCLVVNNSGGCSRRSSSCSLSLLNCRQWSRETKFKHLFVKFSVIGPTPLSRCMSCSSPTFLPALHLQIQTPPLPSSPSHHPLVERGAHRHLSSHHTPPPLQAAAVEQEEPRSVCLGLVWPVADEGEGGGADGRTGCFQDFG